MKKYFLFFVFIFYFIIVKSQNITISGSVSDKNTKEPLAFVNISIQEVTGTITDFDGNFNLSFSDKYKDEKFIVTCVGYEISTLSVKDYQNKNDVLIELKPKDFNIDEVTVVGKSLFPYTILKNVVLNVYKNNYQKPFNYLINYLSEDYSKNKLIKSREAVINLYDNSGYKKIGEYQAYNSISFEFLSVKRNFEIYSLNDGYVNIDDVLKCDIVKFPNNILEIEHLTDYELELKEEIFEKDSVWIISYKCLNTNGLNTGDIFANSYFGKITIKKDNYAVLKNEIEVSSSGLSTLGKSFYTDNKDIENVKYKCTTTFNFENEYYFLKSIECNLTYNQKEIESGKSIEKKNIQKINIQKVEINNVEKITNKQYFENL